MSEDGQWTGSCDVQHRAAGPSVRPSAACILYCQTASSVCVKTLTVYLCSNFLLSNHRRMAEVHGLLYDEAYMWIIRALQVGEGDGG